MNMSQAFFINGKDLAISVTDTASNLRNQVFTQVIAWVTIISVIIVIGALHRIKRVSYKMTAQIISLYETLYMISSDRSNRGGAVELTFKPSNKELNDLHLAFNKTARTINLATQSISG